MDLSLDGEQQDFATVARDFCEAEIVPHRRDWDRREEVDLSVLAKMAEIGFFGMTIPEEYGGVGGDHVTYCVGMEELGRADSAVRGIVSVSNGLVGKAILAHGTQEQKHRWLPTIADGSTLGCFALTEAGSGSDAASLITSAVRDGDEYVINGSKMFITNGTWARLCLVFARTGGPGPKGISAFLVPADTPGLTRTEITGKLGLRGQATAELAFDQVRVPVESRLGAEGEGFSIAMKSLDKGRVSVAAGCTGIIAGCLDAVIDYTRDRQQFGRPIASFQLLQDMIAEISVAADAARLLTWRAADLIDRGRPFGTDASKAKLFASEAAVRSANQAIQAFGGYGYLDDFPVQKYLRDARVMTLYEGTSQVQKLLIGRAETGVNAFF
jgi:alkylation response protein AidB-like acyl-CoA dehydrogenase